MICPCLQEEGVAILLNNDIEFRLINIGDKIQEIQDTGTRGQQGVKMRDSINFPLQIYFWTFILNCEENKSRFVGDRDQDQDNVESWHKVHLFNFIGGKLLNKIHK